MRLFSNASWHSSIASVLFVVAGCLPSSDVLGQPGSGSPIETGARTRYVVVITIDGIRQDMADSLLAPLFAWAAEEATWLPNHVSRTRCITDPNHMILIGVPNEGAPLVNREFATLPFATELIRLQWKRPASDVAVFTGKEHVYLTCLSSTTLGDSVPAYGRLLDPLQVDQGPDDSTATAAIDYIREHHPVLTLVNLSQFDWVSHARTFPHINQWPDKPRVRERQIRRWREKYWTDLDRVGRRAGELAREIVMQIEADSIMSGRTTYVITTDHGRHDPDYCREHGLENNWDHAHEGDCCAGCRDIWAILYGPDTQRGFTVSRETDITEIEPTYRLLLGYRNDLNHAPPIPEAFPAEVLATLRSAQLDE